MEVATTFAHGNGSADTPTQDPNTSTQDTETTISSTAVNTDPEESGVPSPRGDQNITGAQTDDDSLHPHISSSTPTLGASTAAPSLISRPPPNNDAQAPPDIRALMSNQFPEINKTIVDELVTQPRNQLESVTKVFSDETRRLG
jgi:hypothetical protein